jgi:hypothetical protein
MDFKSLIIGFLLCLCMVLLTGFGGSSEVGRYQFPDGYARPFVIDTSTGIVKYIELNKEFKDYPVKGL